MRLALFVWNYDPASNRFETSFSDLRYFYGILYAYLRRNYTFCKDSDRLGLY
jgi:hypothetical protein